MANKKEIKKVALSAFPEEVDKDGLKWYGEMSYETQMAGQQGKEMAAHQAEQHHPAAELERRSPSLNGWAFLLLEDWDEITHKKQFYHFNRVKRKIFWGKRLDLLKKHIPLRTNNNLKHKIRYVCSRFSYPYPVAHRLDDGF